MPCEQRACAPRPNILQQLPEKRRELEDYINSLPLDVEMERRRGLLIQCLHRAQHIFGYLPLEIQEFVGDKLRLQHSDVNGVISFYAYFTEVPFGKYKINVCTGTACFVKGADKILDEFSQKLGIGREETTADGKFSLMCLRCVGACSLAPVVTVNDRVYANVTPKMVARILKDCD